MSESLLLNKHHQQQEQIQNVQIKPFGNTSLVTLFQNDYTNIIKTQESENAIFLQKNILLEDDDQKFLISNLQLHYFTLIIIQDNLCRMSFPLFQSNIYYFDPKNMMYIHINKELDLYLNYQDIEKCDRLIIKFKLMQNNIDQFLEDEEYKEDDDNPEKQKRVKERTLQFALQIVEEWRKLNEEGLEEGNQKIKVNLDQSAHILGMSRKTLNDYALQIKKGKQKGFDFDANLNQKIGVLRKFNRIQESQFFEDQHKSEDIYIENQYMEIQQVQIGEMETGMDIEGDKLNTYQFQNLNQLSSDEEKIRFADKIDSDEDLFFSKKKQDSSFDLQRND